MPSKQPDGTYSEIIDDIEYCFQLWGAEKSLNIGIQIAALLSKSADAASLALMPKTSDGDESESVAKQKTAAMMASIIGSLFASMGERRTDASEVIRTLATEGIIRIDAEGKRRPMGAFNEYYRGKLGHLRKVVTAAAEVQYGDFFSDVGAYFEGMQPSR